MKPLKYADDMISSKEIMIAIPSIVIGVGVLSLPNVLADSTMAADGVVALLIGGLIAIFLTWFVARLAIKFPHKSFFDYCSMLTSRPIGITFSVLLAFQGLFLVASQSRLIAEVSSKYIFGQTPLTVTAMVFLWVVIYAVSGSRAGVFRLNIMFFPIIVFISIVLICFTLVNVEKANFLPLLKTDIQEQWKAMRQSVTSLTGFGILLFYTKFVKEPKKVPKKAALGMALAVGLYVVFFLVCIGVFGNQVSGNLLYPTVELAKAVEIPGDFFERFELLFFVIWIMAIFNTAAISLDVSILALNAIFKKDRKQQLIFLLTPLAFFIGMVPKDTAEASVFAKFMGYYGLIVTMTITIILFIAVKVKKGKQHEGK